MIDLKKNQSPASYRHIIPVLAMLLVLLMISILYVALNDKPRDATKAPVVVKPVQLTSNDVYAALFRQVRADQACIDYSRNQVLLHFNKSETVKPGEDDYWIGWWVVDMPTFYRLPGNNTWYTKDLHYKDFTKIYPNVKDHKCGLAKNYEGL